MDRGGMKRVENIQDFGTLGPLVLLLRPSDRPGPQNPSCFDKLGAPRDAIKCCETGDFWGSTCQHYIPILVPNQRYRLSLHSIAVRALGLLCISDQTGGL